MAKNGKANKPEKCNYCGKKLKNVRFRAIIGGELVPFCDKYCHADKSKGKESTKIMIR